MQNVESYREPFNQPSTIETIEMPSSYRELAEKYILPGIPVLIKNYWKPGFLDDFTPERVATLFNDEPVTVNFASGGYFKINEETGAFEGSRQMPIGAVLDKLSSGTGEWYLQQLPVQSQPGLAARLDIPAILDGKSVDEVLFWLGANSVTSLHYDYANNFLCQLHGRKLITLYTADVFEELYPNPDGSKAPHVSQVMIERPDHARYPRFADATPIRVVLEAGDILFMPSCTWHQIRNDGVCASFNIWWPMHVEQTIHRGFSRYLSNFYEDLPTSFANLEKSAVSDLLGFAQYAYERKAYRTAAVVACAHLEAGIRRALEPAVTLPELDAAEMRAWLGGTAAQARYPDGQAARLAAVFDAVTPLIDGSRDTTAAECAALLATVAALSAHPVPA